MSSVPQGSLPLFALPLLAIASGLLVAPPARAQLDDHANGGLQFDFKIPGARALGRGGTFIASSDDATAAYTNPAGLFQLSKAEIVAEARRTEYSTPFALRGRANGTATGRGVDNLAGIEYGEIASENQGVSHFAFAFPRANWAIGVFHNKTADFTASFATEGIFSTAGRLKPARVDYAIEIDQNGFAYAYQRNDIKVGLSVSQFNLKLDSYTQRFATRAYEPASFSPSQVDHYSTLQADFTAIGASVGVLWEKDKNSFGMVYRFNPEFELDVLLATYSPGTPAPPRSIAINQQVLLKMPDVIGIGFAHRAANNLTFSLDFQTIYYSQLLEGMISLYGRDTEDFKIDDVVETHAGLEYLLLQLKVPISLRVGAYFDPDHRIRYEGDDPLQKAVFYAGDDLIHWTAGIGFSLGTHIQLDGAVDVSDLNRTGSVSVIYRF